MEEPKSLCCDVSSQTRKKINDLQQSATAIFYSYITNF